MKYLSQDLGTMTIFAGMMTFALAFCMGLFKHRRVVHSGYANWVIAAALNSAGMFMISTRGYAPDFITILAANACFILFYIYVYRGIDKLAGAKSGIAYTHAAILSAMLGLFVYFTYIQPDFNTRVIIFSFTVSAIIFTGIFSSVRQLKRNAPYRTKMLVISLYIVGFWFIFRSAAHLLMPFTGTNSFFNSETLSQASLIVMCLSSIFIIISLIVITSETLSYQLSQANRELEKALSEVKELRGLIPICCFCKKIRNDDKGYYEAIESYIQTHTDANFTHTICDECLQEMYPECIGKPKELEYDKEQPPL